MEGLDANDHIGMRKWLAEVYLRLRAEPQTTRVRTRTPVAVKNVPITYGSDNNFSVRIYDPTPDTGKESSLRPALLMFHGGGWVHGFPEVDEGEHKPSNPLILLGYRSLTQTQNCRYSLLQNYELLSLVWIIVLLPSINSQHH
jgi:hypothetical protein